MELLLVEKTLQLMELVLVEKILEVTELVLIDKMVDNFTLQYANYEKIISKHRYS